MNYFEIFQDCWREWAEKMSEEDKEMYEHNMGTKPTEYGVKMVEWISVDGEKISNVKAVSILNDQEETIRKLKQELMKVGGEKARLEGLINDLKVVAEENGAISRCRLCSEIEIHLR